MAKPKFKVKEKVGRQYSGNTYRVAEIKQKVRYEYLLEESDGTRFWSDEGSMRKKAKAKGK